MKEHPPQIPFSQLLLQDTELLFVSLHLISQGIHLHAEYNIPKKQKE